MSLAVGQMLIAGIIGLLVVIVVVRLSRRGQLSFRYTIGWIGVASFGILAGLFVPVKVSLAFFNSCLVLQSPVNAETKGQSK